MKKDIHLVEDWSTFTGLHKSQVLDELRAAKELLRTIEWEGRGPTSAEYCPCCGNPRFYEDHADDCKLYELIKEKD